MAVHSFLPTCSFELYILRGNSFLKRGKKKRKEKKYFELEWYLNLMYLNAFIFTVFTLFKTDFWLVCYNSLESWAAILFFFFSYFRCARYFGNIFNLEIKRCGIASLALCRKAYIQRRWFRCFLSHETELLRQWFNRDQGCQIMLLELNKRPFWITISKTS